MFFQTLNLLAVLLLLSHSHHVLLCDAMDFSPLGSWPLSMHLLGNNYWSALPLPSPDLPKPWIKPASLMVLLHLQAGSELPKATGNKLL